MIRVKAGFFSLTPPPAADEDENEYLRWHLLDHMPEQFSLPGIQWAQRYIADGAYLESRIDDRPFGPVGNVVNYLVGDPVQQTHDDFMELGRRLAEAGRFPHRRSSLQVRMPALIRWYASPRVQVTAEVVPFRPHRGIILVTEERSDADPAPWLRWLHSDHYPALLAAPGVAGVWMYSSTDTWKLHHTMQGAPQYTTVIYLDDDPLAAAKTLAQRLTQRWNTGHVRPVCAAPFRTMIRWEAWP